MDETLTDCLSRSLVDVADEAFRKQSRSLTKDQLAATVTRSLRSLDELKQGRMPDYHNEWVALMYATWYHPGQVSLAWSIINSMRPRFEGALYIVDFGCGSLAMRFGVALTVADALGRGESIGKIRVHSTDPSGVMIESREQDLAKNDRYCQT